MIAKQNSGRWVRPMREELAPEMLRELHSRAGTEESSVVAHDATPFAEAMIRDALWSRATDVHLDPQRNGAVLRFRIDGELADVCIISPECAQKLLRHLKAIAGLDSGPTFRPAIGHASMRLDGGEVDLRLASAPTVAGEKMNLRLLNPNAIRKRLQELGLSPDHHDQVRRWLESMSGMVLLAGPMGGGKTTTLYALLHELRYSNRCVATVEDPVEYLVEGIVQVQVDPRHEMGAANALHAVMRLDPDVLVVGELRDTATARAATEAANAGRVLLATVRAPDAVGAVSTLRDLGVPGGALSTALHMVMAQRLVRHLCPHCRRPHAVSDTECNWLSGYGIEDVPSHTWDVGGCEQCKGLGHIGRVGLFEVWRLHGWEHAHILRHAGDTLLRQHAADSGMITMIQDGWMKVEHGITSLSELRLAAAGYPEPSWSSSITEPHGRIELSSETLSNQTPLP